MNSRNDAFLTRLAMLTAAATAAMTLGGCASDGGDSSYGGVSTSVSVGYGYGGYYGGGYYPGYYPGGYPPVVVVPPSWLPISTSMVFAPARAAWRAAIVPAVPPPITSTST